MIRLKLLVQLWLNCWQPSLRQLLPCRVLLESHPRSLLLGSTLTVIYDEVCLGLDVSVALGASRRPWQRSDVRFVKGSFRYIVIKWGSLTIRSAQGWACSLDLWNFDHLIWFVVGTGSFHTQKYVFANEAVLGLGVETGLGLVQVIVTLLLQGILSRKVLKFSIWERDFRHLSRGCVLWT